MHTSKARMEPGNSLLLLLLLLLSCLYVNMLSFLNTALSILRSLTMHHRLQNQTYVPLNSVYFFIIKI